MYKQPIILFGIVIPLVIAAVLIGACVMVKGKFQTSYDNKARYFVGHEQSRMGALGIEAQLNRERKHLERWDELLSEETSSHLATNLRLIGAALPDKEFQQTAFERLGNSSGFGSASAQKSSGLKLSLRGTYRTVQRAFLELETRMPNLQLQELKMDPNLSADSALLNFQVTYTAWEK